MSDLIRCLVVDDEPSAQQVLERYIADVPRLRLSAVCEDALQAMEILREGEMDLLFLDINLPRLSGISMLKSLSDRPSVILTTAYDDYALEGYELDVVDYLLKPFSFERFLKAVRKAEERMGDAPGGDTFLMVRADGKNYRVDYGEILYIASLGDYVTVHGAGRRLTTYDTLKNLEATLPSRRFLRVHKSYIVNLAKIDYLEGNRIFVEGNEIPVGGTYKEEVSRRLGG